MLASSVKSQVFLQIKITQLYVSSSGTFASETDKVVYGLVFPIKTFEILYVQVSPIFRQMCGYHKSAIGRTTHLHPSECKHRQ